jgi:hypothetical protein
MEGAPLLGTKGKMNFQGMRCRRYCRQASLHRGPVWEPGEEARLQDTVRDDGRRALEMEHLSYWELLGEPGDVKEESGNGHLFPLGSLVGKPGRGLICQGLVWKKVLRQMSPPRGAPLGGRSIYPEL